MIIGLTYDLRPEYLAQGYTLEETAEFDKPETIEGIEGALQQLGHQTDRIGSATALMARLGRGDRWDLVFNIAEGLWGYGRESLVPCLLEAHRIPYTFSDSMVLALSLHKGMCKRVIRDLGIPTADFRVVQCLEDLDTLSFPFPLFAKPVAEGTGKGITAASTVHGSQELKEVCETLLREFQQPVLVESYLPGREFTVGLVGTGAEARVVGVLEVIFNQRIQPVYSYGTKENYQDIVDYQLLGHDFLAKQIVEVSLAAWRALECRDGGRVDVRLDEQGVPNFLEVNPLAGLNPIHSDLPILCYQAGWSYVQLIEAILDSAQKRIPHAYRRAA